MVANILGYLHWKSLKECGRSVSVDGGDHQDFIVQWKYYIAEYV